MTKGKIILSSDPGRIMQANEGDLSHLSRSDHARLESALRDGWRLTPATMADKITNGRWIATRHLLYISTIVATAIAKGNARIILTMPFRHGKSEFLSVNTPIWFLEKWPRKYVMNLTYGAELATDFSHRVRETFQNEDLHHLLRARLNKKKQRVDRFLTTEGGGLTAAGIGGPIVGRGADLMCIDDYVKNTEDAMSMSYHEKVFEWFKATAYTRLEPNASLIVLATRWWQHDLIGKLITEMPHENWVVINLPMLAMVNDPLGRAIDEPLWPERYDYEACMRIKKTLGSFWFEAQCQQNPPASMSGAELGNQLKIIPEADVPDDLDLETVRVWDLAATEGGGDYSCGLKMSRHKVSGRIFIRNIIRGQHSSGKNKHIISAAADADGHGVKIWMEQEPGSSGVTVIDDYELLLPSYNFQGEKATGRIEVRAGPYLGALEAGNVYIVEGDYVANAKHELNVFPDGENDDQITCMALGYNKLVLGVSGALTWGRGEKGSNVTPIGQAPRKRRRRLRADSTGERHKQSVRRLTW